jgi:hypothetical protein
MSRLIEAPVTAIIEAGLSQNFQFSFHQDMHCDPLVFDASQSTESLLSSGKEAVTLSVPSTVKVASQRYLEIRIAHCRFVSPLALVSQSHPCGCDD